MITREGYDQIFVLRNSSDVYEKSVIPRAQEIAKEIYGPGLWRFTFTPKWVYVFENQDQDEPNYFAAELMWDADWKATIARNKLEAEERYKKQSEAMKLVEAKRIEQNERAELARLKAKYPDA